MLLRSAAGQSTGEFKSLQAMLREGRGAELSSGQREWSSDSTHSRGRTNEPLGGREADVLPAAECACCSAQRGDDAIVQRLNVSEWLQSSSLQTPLIQADSDRRTESGLTSAWCREGRRRNSETIHSVAALRCCRAPRCHSTCRCHPRTGRDELHHRDTASARSSPSASPDLRLVSTAAAYQQSLRARISFAELAAALYLSRSSVAAAAFLSLIVAFTFILSAAWVPGTPASRRADCSEVRVVLSPHRPSSVCLCPRLPAQQAARYPGRSSAAQPAARAALEQQEVQQGALRLRLQVQPVRRRIAR